MKNRYRVNGGNRRKDSMEWAGASGWVETDGDTWTDEAEARSAFASAVEDARQNCPAFDYVQLTVAGPESFEMSIALETVELGPVQ